MKILQSAAILSIIESKIPREIKSLKNSRQVISWLSKKDIPEVSNLIETISQSGNPVGLILKHLENSGNPHAKAYLDLVKNLDKVNEKNANVFVEKKLIPFYDSVMAPLFSENFSRSQMQVMDLIGQDLPRAVISDHYSGAFSEVSPSSVKSELARKALKSVGFAALLVLGFPAIFGETKDDKKEKTWQLVLKLVVFFGVAIILLQIVTNTYPEIAYLMIIVIFFLLLMFSKPPEKKESDEDDLQ